jgi:hypothetical protein
MFAVLAQNFWLSPPSSTKFLPAVSGSCAPAVVRNSIISRARAVASSSLQASKWATRSAKGRPTPIGGSWFGSPTRTDDGSNTTLGTQLDDLRNFISSQPDATTVGVAYMRDGVAQVVQDLTRDHSLAAKALRLPLGIRGVNGSPYLSLTDLVKRWPTSTARRAAIVVTDGIDRLYGMGDLQDPYLDE